MSGFSWVTLATNDSYSLGALVLAHSLKRVGTIHNLTVLVTPGVSSSMRDQLSTAFNVVQEVNILDSKDEKNLTLLTRPELGVTFTKLHCWRLTQFSKCVFLDADVLVLRNCDELFDRDELSAAPDVGWPDCFNSGVFVYRPSIETYNEIINLALSQGSFDGGDQGLLNQFFSDWATKDISRHLPFIYNMCSSATYSYLPAFKQFGKDVKIVHFIGSSKPWLQYLDSETRQVRPSLGSEHLQGLLQLWWDIFCNDIHSKLSPEMVDRGSQASQLQNSTKSYVVNEILLNLQPECSLKISVPSSSIYEQDLSYGYWDPWETYQEPNTESDKRINLNQNISSDTSFLDQQSSSVQNVEDKSVVDNCTGYMKNNTHNKEEATVLYSSQSTNSNSIILDTHTSLQSQTTHTVDDNDRCKCSSTVSNIASAENVNKDTVSSHDYNSNCLKVLNQEGTEHEQSHSQNIHGIGELVDKQSCSDNRYHDKLFSNSDVNVSYEHGSSVNTDPVHLDDKKPLVPPDNHVSISLDTECLTPSATTELTEPDAGLAGALSQLTLGVARSPEQMALEEHLRKQAWEHGNIDYMGRDSFDKIWQKICQTLAEPPPDHLPEVRELPSDVASVVVNTISQEVISDGDVPLTSLQQPHSVTSEFKEISDISLSGIPPLPLVKETTNVVDTLISDHRVPEFENAHICKEDIADVTTPDISLPVGTSIALPISSLDFLPQTISDIPSLSDNSHPVETSSPNMNNIDQSLTDANDSEFKLSETSLDIASEICGATEIVSTLEDAQPSDVDLIISSQISLESVMSVIPPEAEGGNVTSSHISSETKVENVTSSQISCEVEAENVISSPIAPIAEAENVISRQIPSEAEAENETSCQIPREVEVENVISSQIPSESEAENVTSSQIPHEVEAENVISSQIPSEAEAENVTSSQIPHEVEAENVISRQIPSEGETENETSCQIPCEVDVENVISSQIPSEAKAENVTCSQIPHEVEAENVISSKIPSEAVAEKVTSGQIPHEVVAENVISSQIPSEAEAENITCSKISSESVMDPTSKTIMLSEVSSSVSKTDLNDVPESQPLPETSVVSQSTIEENKSSSEDPITDLQSVNVIEPTPPTSPSDTLLPQTLVSSDTNVLTIDSSIPDTPPVDSQRSNISESSPSISTTNTSSSTTSTSTVSQIQESALPSGRSQTETPAPVPPKRRNRPSQKVQKEKK